MRCLSLRNRVPAQLSSALIGACLLAAGATHLAHGSDTPKPAAAPPLRVAVSDKVMAGVNLNDARAAMAVWAKEVLESIGYEADSRQDPVMPSGRLLSAIRGGALDLFALTAQEYREVIPYVDTSRVIVNANGGDELLLVVREGGGIANLAGLRGRTLIVPESPQTGLAEVWLAVSLWRDGLESPKQLLRSLTRSAKLSQAVLPVYFGQADACVVTRQGLTTMAELNPQLSRRLKVLLSSPPMVSVFFSCRTDYPAHLRKTIFDRLSALKLSPATTQLQTLFQSPGFVLQDASCLRTANSLLETYERHAAAAGRNR